MENKVLSARRDQELEIEMWNLKMKKLEKVETITSVDFLTNIYENVKSARPKTLDETIELANDLMDLKIRILRGVKAI
ncbi:hypothetical protein Tco_0618320 [Tanacetum coccineum]